MSPLQEQADDKRQSGKIQVIAIVHKMYSVSACVCV